MISTLSYETINDLFANQMYSDDNSVCGFNWTIDGELIGPCIWNKKWLNEIKCPIVYHQYIVVEAEENNLCLFFPIKELRNLTTDLYNSIMEDFKLQIKKLKHKLKLENINDDF